MKATDTDSKQLQRLVNREFHTGNWHINCGDTIEHTLERILKKGLRAGYSWDSVKISPNLHFKNNKVEFEAVLKTTHYRECNYFPHFPIGMRETRLLRIVGTGVLKAYFCSTMGYAPVQVIRTEIEIMYEEKK